MTPDTARFLDLLKQHAPFFDAARPIAIARAPGRLDVMGGIADYSGSLVLQMPLAAAAFAAAQWTEASERRVRVRTTDASAAHGSVEVTATLDDLLADYGSARAHFAADPARHWAAYVAGAVTVLHRERSVTFDRGVRWLIASDVPAGKGVSSSAAIEVAAMQSLGALFDPPIQLDGRDLALLCQKVENAVVGAPCGVMDQMTAACGRTDSLLALLCQPAELQAPVALPSDVQLLGIDSGIRHAVSGADYASVRVGAFMGHRIIVTLGGLAEDGYLANVAPDEWERRFRDLVPERLTGAAFLATYGRITDSVTTVDPARTYAIRQPTAHPIYEHRRVRRFRSLLENGSMRDRTSDRALTELGALMYQSHESYSACGLGSDGTDAIVELVRGAGSARGLYGAKITGGGSGGTVAVLARRGGGRAVEDVAARYTRMTGRGAMIISGSSDGALTFGTITRRLPGDSRGT
jgi:L-arabinokinase